jgi:CRP-like cAMP-binding protein
MKTIPHMHDFISLLPAGVQEEIDRLSKPWKLTKGEPIYRQGDESQEIYRLVSGTVRLCSYSSEGKEYIAGEFRAGDCFGEMGLIDGMPRVSHAVAVQDSFLRVLSKADFDALYQRYPEIGRQCLIMLCRRVRHLYGLNAEASGLTLRQRLALTIARLAHSQGLRDSSGEQFIGISQEELGKMLGVSRQSISKEIKRLQKEEVIDLRYGKIYICSLSLLLEKYEGFMDVSQIAAVYDAD